MTEKHQCSATNCIYETRDIEEKDLARGGGNKYYHRKCIEYRERMGDCVATYLKYISSETPKNLLGRAFKEMIYTKGIDPNYILFCIQQCALTHKRLKSVFSLYYIMDNNNMRDAYEMHKNNRIHIDYDSVETVEETKINCKPAKRKGWDKIIKN